MIPKIIVEIKYKAASEGDRERPWVISNKMITIGEGFITIGALCTHSDISNSPDIQKNITGLADLAVNGLMSVAGENFYLNLLMLYIATVLATELITNNAAAVLMFPLAQIKSSQLGASLLPFAIIIMFGASSSFMTPMGYQTNLMVQGAGGYTVQDFFKVGVGLSLIVGLMVILIVPLIWPF